MPYPTMRTSRVTAIIKTFLRNDYLKRCVDSMLLQYPDIRIGIADDGYPDPAGKSIKERIPEWKREWYAKLGEAGHFVISMPFDSGLCAGRNELVSMARTEFVLVGDDDFAYDQRARVERMVQFLDEHPEIDLIGGRIIQDGIPRDYQGFIDLSDKKHIKMSPLAVEKH